VRSSPAHGAKHNPRGRGQAAKHCAMDIQQTTCDLPFICRAVFFAGLTSAGSVLLVHQSLSPAAFTTLFHLDCATMLQ
jgi:hypothetical protein